MDFDKDLRRPKLRDFRLLQGEVVETINLEEIQSQHSSQERRWYATDTTNSYLRETVFASLLRNRHFSQWMGKGRNFDAGRLADERRSQAETTKVLGAMFHGFRQLASCFPICFVRKIIQ